MEYKKSHHNYYLIFISSCEIKFIVKEALETKKSKKLVDLILRIKNMYFKEMPNNRVF
jgi:hypothetical protein